MREAESGRSGSFWTLVMVIFFPPPPFFYFFALMQNTRTRLCVFLACNTHTQNKRRHSVLLVLTREGSNPKTHMLLIFIHGNFNKLQIALIKMKSLISSFTTHTNTHSYTRSPLITPLRSPGKLAGRFIISEVTGRMGWTWLMGDICRICLLSGQNSKE